MAGGAPGRALCRWCGRGVPTRRFMFYSDWWVREWRLPQRRWLSSGAASPDGLPANIRELNVRPASSRFAVPSGHHHSRYFRQPASAPYSDIIAHSAKLSRYILRVRDLYRVARQIYMFPTTREFL
jgi:hypothetical protein